MIDFVQRFFDRLFSKRGAIYFILFVCILFVLFILGIFNPNDYVNLSIVSGVVAAAMFSLIRLVINFFPNLVDSHIIAKKQDPKEVEYSIITLSVVLLVVIGIVLFINEYIYEF